MSELTQAWQHLLDDLAEAGRTITGPTGAVDEREEAEGFRHLTRALSIALEMLVEKGDPAHPEITRWMNPHRKMMGDNPGTIYDAVMIDPAHHYRLYGNRGETTYLGVCLYGTGENGSRRVAANLDADIAYSANGDFELHLAAERPADLPEGASFLAIDPDVTDLLMRQYFHDPASQAEATYAVEVVGNDQAPPPATASAVAASLTRAGRYVRDLIEVESTISAISAMTAPAEIGKPGAPGPTAEVNWDAVNRVQPTPAVGYSGAWFADLDPDEAVVVEGKLPECTYASVQWLSRWMESGDYAHHRVLLTDREMELDEDRRFRVTLSAHDPGEGPWLDTTGIRNGTFVVRTLGAADSSPAEVEYRRLT